VRSIRDTRQRHSNHAVTDVGKVKVDPELAVNEASLVLRDCDLEMLLDLVREIEKALQGSHRTHPVQQNMKPV
jgi:hypothetical protein